MAILAAKKTLEDLNLTSYSVDLRLHKSIFLNPRLKSDSSMLIQRWQNFFSDVCFSHNELPKLIEELKVLTSDYPSYHSVGEALSKIQLLVEEAKKNNLNVYVFSD
jgi:hypothetical protein